MKKNTLRSLRLALGLSQARLALFAGLSQRAISSMERGERLGRPSTWAAVARAPKNCGAELGEGDTHERG
jgi:transcriptional regulator with XRE-family HTH domain